MTLSRAAFQAWLDRSIAAWLRGRAAIVADWTDDPDDPATWQAAYAPLAIDGDIHVASGESSYLAADGTPEHHDANVFVCRFDADGRCFDFTEWWTLDRRFDA